MPAIPDRQPISDSFNGAVLQVNAAQALAVTVPTGIQIVASGEFIVRYAIRYLGKPHLSIVPGLVALDYGDMLTAEDAWNFLLKRSTLYPRADVIGYRNDGVDEMVVVKQLDLAEPIDVYVYPDANATVPCAHPTALIAPVDAEIPPRLLEYLPRYATIEDWQTHE
jgi:hypothetical protein